MAPSGPILARRSNERAFFECDVCFTLHVLYVWLGANKQKKVTDSIDCFEAGRETAVYDERLCGFCVFNASINVYKKGFFFFLLLCMMFIFVWLHAVQYSTPTVYYVRVLIQYFRFTRNFCSVRKVCLFACSCLIPSKLWWLRNISADFLNLFKSISTMSVAKSLEKLTIFGHTKGFFCQTKLTVPLGHLRPDSDGLTERDNLFCEKSGYFLDVRS